MDVAPFKIAIPHEQIDDLKLRLQKTRWPAVISTDWEPGQPVAFTRELADRWIHDFDWRKHEARINAHP